MKYIISTLGCKVNQYETQAMETILQSRGHTQAETGEEPDVVIVNTCAVTAESGRKSRQTIRRLRDEHPDAIIAVGGCYSQLSPEDSEEIGASVIFGTGDRRLFIDAVERAVASGEKCRNVDKPFERRVYEELPAGAVSGRTRAMLKIQDGCVNFCTYCIIPYTRGRLRSLPREAAVEEARKLSAEGYRELVLTGIEVASYGRDLPGNDTLADVVTDIEKAVPQMRIHLGSLEPTVITDDFCRRLKEAGNICRHFHLSLQSGCDRTLKNMNRKYDTATFYEKVCLLREYFPGCAITCDLITGFPGETDSDQADTIAFIEKCGFSAMHIFPYSRRPGTPADRMPDQCTNAVKNARAKEAQAIAEKMKQEFLKQSVGETLSVLFETPEGDGYCTGHSDTYLLVRAKGKNLRGRLCDVRITGVINDILTGEIID